jgi:hypothetical protein
VAAWLIDLGARHVVGRLAGKNADRLQTLVVVSTAAPAVCAVANAALPSPRQPPDRCGMASRPGNTIPPVLAWSSAVTTGPRMSFTVRGPTRVPAGELRVGRGHLAVGRGPGDV